jgi:hypothetical protein
MTQHTPHSAVLVLTDALDCLDMVEPPLARGPIRAMFRAAMQQCVTTRSLEGKPVAHVVALAEALTTAARGDRL